MPPVTYQAIFLLLEVVIPFQGKDSCATYNWPVADATEPGVRTARRGHEPKFYPAKPGCHCLSVPPAPTLAPQDRKGRGDERGRGRRPG